MGLIAPSMTLKEVSKHASETEKGRGKKHKLPGVKADAKTADPKAHKKNRELAKRISKAVASLKTFDRDKKTGKAVPRFVLAWRLYPNRENPYWKTEALQHACGCSAACFAPHPGHHPKPRKPPRRKK